METGSQDACLSLAERTVVDDIRDDPCGSPVRTDGQVDLSSLLDPRTRYGFLVHHRALGHVGGIAGIYDGRLQLACRQCLHGFLGSHALYVGHTDAFAVMGIEVDSFQRTIDDHQHEHHHAEDVEPEDAVLLERKEFFDCHKFNELSICRQR